MAKYRKISTRIYADARFRALSSPNPCGQSLFIHLLIRYPIIPGIIISGEAALAEELGWDVKGFREAFREVLELGLVKADFKSRLIFLPKALLHNFPESPNVIISWKNFWEEITECALKSAIYEGFLKVFDERGEAYRKAFDKAIPKTTPIQEQEQEQEQEYILSRKRDRSRVSSKRKTNLTPQEVQWHNDAKEVILFLNEKTGKNFELVSSNLDFIMTRLRHGASLEDCRAVIANKCRKWRDNDEMREYLRPKTLFNAKNFAQYMGELKITPESGNGNDKNNRGDN
jgi:uncharacterized phage protein (TIGR02220 family)